MAKVLPIMPKCQIVTLFIDLKTIRQYNSMSKQETQFASNKNFNIILRCPSVYFNIFGTNKISKRFKKQQKGLSTIINSNYR